MAVHSYASFGRSDAAGSLNVCKDGPHSAWHSMASLLAELVKLPLTKSRISPRGSLSPAHHRHHIFARGGGYAGRRRRVVHCTVVVALSLAS